MKALASGVALAMVATVGPAVQDPGEALARMVATERAFAAATAEIGVRDGFLTFFAPDAIEMITVEAPGPTVAVTSAIESLRRRPSATLPLAARLTWEPITGMVSRDGSMGWLTGPYATIDAGDGGVRNQGVYFSVWKRQDDGAWRVWLDQGISTAEVWQPAGGFRPAAVPHADSSDGETLEAAEQAVAGGGDGWTARLAGGVRLNRGGLLPIEGREAVIAWAARTRTAVDYTGVRLERASSDDLGVALGGFTADTVAGPERGFWVRVWQRDESGRWRIVFELSQGI